MMKKFLITFLLLALAGVAAAQSADPYGELAAYDFKQSSPAVKTITEEAQTARPEARAAIEAKLLAAAEKPGATFACQSFVADMLRVVGSKACLPVVTKWLGDPKTASLALLALQGLKDPEVLTALEKAMREAQGVTKIGLIQSLAARGDNGIVGDLVTLTKNPDAALVRVAVEALGMIGSAEAAMVLIDLDPAKPLTRADRAQALLAIAVKLDGGEHKEISRRIRQNILEKSPHENLSIAALNGLIATEGEKAVPQVLKAMGDEHPVLAIRAAAAARALSASATAKLCEALPKLSAPVQVALLRALGERQDKAALSAVQTAMKSPDEAIRREAVLATETLGDASVLQPLLALAGGSDTVATAAQRVLGRINQPGIDEALLKQLDNPKADVVSASAGVLAARGYQPALPRLLDLAGAADGGIRSAALRGAQDFVGQADIPKLMEILAKADKNDYDKVTPCLWAAVRGINPKEKRFEFLWNLALEGNTNARVALLPLAALGGGSSSLATVSEQAQSSDDAVKDAALRALFAWSDDLAAPAVLEVIKTTDKLNYRVLAAQALARQLTNRKAKTPKAQRQAMLEEALVKLDRPEDKQQIQWALEQLKNPTAGKAARGTGGKKGQGKGNRQGKGKKAKAVNP